jgi:hypothetical protein
LTDRRLLDHIGPMAANPHDPFKVAGEMIGLVILALALGPILYAILYKLAVP